MILTILDWALALLGAAFIVTFIGAIVILIYTGDIDALDDD